MPQNDRNSRNRKRRRAYDQARDDRRGGQSTQRRSSAGAGSDLGYSGYAGYSSGGHPITNPNYDPDAPRPSRYTERTVTTAPTRITASPFPPAGGAARAAHSAPAAGRTASGAPPGAISGTAARLAARTGTPSAARRTPIAAAASGCGRCRGRTPGVTPSGGRAGKSGS